MASIASAALGAVVAPILTLALFGNFDPREGNLLPVVAAQGFLVVVSTVLLTYPAVLARNGQLGRLVALGILVLGIAGWALVLAAAWEVASLNLSAVVAYPAIATGALVWALIPVTRSSGG